MDKRTNIFRTAQQITSACWFIISLLMASCSIPARTLPTAQALATIAATPVQLATASPKTNPTIFPTARSTGTPAPVYHSKDSSPSPTAITSWSEKIRLSLGTIACPPQYSPDGRRFAVPTSNGIAIYETAGWREITVISNQELDGKVPCALEFSPDSSILAVSFGNEIRFWRESGQDIPKPIVPGDSAEIRIESVDFSPDGRRLAAGYWRGMVPYSDVYQVSDGKMLFTIKGSQSRFSPDGRRLTTVFTEVPALRNQATRSLVYLFEADQGQVVHYWEGKSVDFLPEDELLIGTANAARIVKTRDGDFSTRLVFNGSTPAASADGKTVAVYQPGRVQIYSLSDGASIRSLELPALLQKVEPDRLLFSTDGSRVAGSFFNRPCDTCERQDGYVYQWENRQGEAGSLIETVSSPAWLSYATDGKNLTVTVTDQIAFYDPASGQSIGSMQGFSNTISEIAISPDGRRLAAGYAEMNKFGIQLWDLSGLGERKSFTPVEIEPAAADWWKMAFSPDGKLVGLGGHFWQVENGSLLPGWPPLVNDDAEKVKAASAIGLAFAPDGKTVTLGLPGGTVQSWDLETLTLAQTLQNEYPGDTVSLAYNPDGTQLYTALAYTLDDYPSPYAQKWQMPAGSPVTRLPEKNIAFIVYAPDGQSLATLSTPFETYQRNYPYGTVKLWSDRSELIRAFPPEHADRISFSPDGQTLAIGLLDGQVQLWGLDGSLIRELDTEQHGVITGLGFTPDGQRLVVASATGMIQVWEKEDR